VRMFTLEPNGPPGVIATFAITLQLISVTAVVCAMLLLRKRL
jgi:hypothetical protein